MTFREFDVKHGAGKRLEDVAQMFAQHHLVEFLKGIDKDLIARIEQNERKIFWDAETSLKVMKGMEFLRDYLIAKAEQNLKNE